MTMIYGMVKDNIFICKNCNTYAYKKNAYKIAYDGNIYSSHIIKQELLSKGYYFETSLEEEIILKSFIEYGFDAYNKFSGHFSIVIWHENKKELTLMRDYYNIKSIYYKKVNNGDLIFSNDLETLLDETDNLIQYDKFITSYLLNFNIDDRLITDSIEECTNVMFYSDEIIAQVEVNNCIEYGYIFDEVCQIILTNLDNISIINLEDGENEISVITNYILENFNKEKKLIYKKFSIEKLENFLTDMALPFYNFIEYNLIFAIDKLKDVVIVDSELNKIKRFFNINYFDKRYNIELVFPRFNREKILGIDRMLYQPNKNKKINCIDRDFVEQKFQQIIKNTKSPIKDFIKKDVNYYKKVYFIRLNNWIERYKIKII